MKAAARTKRKGVLLIGPYGQSNDLERMRLLVNGAGFSGVLLKDYPDIREQALPEKMLLLGSLCRFVICLDTQASGHTAELEACARAGLTTSEKRS
jgi:hypothetical protein